MKMFAKHISEWKTHSEHRKNSENTKISKQPNFKRASNWNRHLIKEDTWMANNHMKRYSALVIRGMQIKTIIRYNYVPIRVNKLKRLTILNVDKDVQNWNSSILLVGKVKLYHFGILFSNFLKSQTHFQYDLAILLPVFTQGKWKHMSIERLVDACFICNSQKLEATQISINRQWD